MFSPFLDSAFQQQMTGWGQLGYLIPPQECGQKAERDKVAERQVEFSLCTLRGVCEGFRSGVRGSREGLDKSDKMTEARRKPRVSKAQLKLESSGVGLTHFLGVWEPDPMLISWVSFPKKHPLWCFLPHCRGGALGHTGSEAQQGVYGKGSPPGPKPSPDTAEVQSQTQKIKPDSS